MAIRDRNAVLTLSFSPDALFSPDAAARSRAASLFLWGPGETTTSRGYYAEAITTDNGSLRITFCLPVVGSCSWVRRRLSSDRLSPGPTDPKRLSSCLLVAVARPDNPVIVTVERAHPVENHLLLRLAEPLPVSRIMSSQESIRSRDRESDC